MTTIQHGEHSVSNACNFTAGIRQLAFWPAAAPPPHRPTTRTATWLEIARALPANLSVEFTAEHGWRIVALSVDARRALELLDISEGDVIPDPVLLERRRRHVEARLMLDQALAVLRSVQADIDAARERVA